jgi:hypothetical protein
VAEEEVQVEAWNTLLLLLEAHQLFASQDWASAAKLLFAGRLPPHTHASTLDKPHSYASFLSSWRFHTFLPVSSERERASERARARACVRASQRESLIFLGEMSVR